MYPAEPSSKRKALKELFRPGKRAHRSASETVLGVHFAAGPVERSLPVEVLSSDQSVTSPAQPGIAHGAKARDIRTATKIAWSTFKATLPILEKVSVVFPPLQSAVGGLIGVIAQFDTCKTNAGKVEELTQTLDQLQCVLSTYPEIMESKQIQRLKLIQRIFEEAMDTVKAQSSKSSLTRFIQGPDDQTKLIESMGKLTRFVNLLQLEVLGQTGLSVKEMHRDIKYEELLKNLDHIPSASFESTDSDIQTRVECTPGTRTQILEMLTAWTLDPDGTPFFWLNGMAGTGKSTIAQSICNRLDADGMLAASFFCSRSAGGGRNDARKIIPTIAFQLAYHLPGFMQEICDVLRTPDRTAQPIEKQMKKLFWEPLDNALVTSTASLSNDVLPPIVVIDGLDECLDAGAQEFVQSLLRRFEHNLPIHLRFILFSRSEKHIGTPIRASTVEVSRFQLHDIPQSIVTQDIRRYAEAGLSQMSSKREWGNKWYKQDDVDFIVLQADVLFIYAATVLKYLEDSKFRPEKRLQILRQLAFTAKTEQTGPLRPLHLLYSIILENLGEADDLEAFEVDLVRNILFILSCSPTPLPIPAIADLIGSELDEVRACIASLSSVVYIPPESEEKAKPIKALHASFPEFVRSSSPLFPVHFRFEAGNYHRLFFLKCLKTLNVRLCEGLLGAKVNKQTGRTDISLEMVSTFISPSLQYASQHFLFHGIESDWQEPLLVNEASEIVSIFVNSHLLHWLECLAWIGSLNNIEKLLTRATVHDLRLLHLMPPDCGHAFRDVLQIIRAKESAFSGDFPYEIYDTGLVWLPKSLSATLNHERTIRSLVTVVRGLAETWFSSRFIERKNLVANSFSTSPNSSLARWLSMTLHGEITAHEWDTRTDSETEYHIGRPANIHVISKIANNGIFFLDPSNHILSFRPLDPSTTHLGAKTWELRKYELLNSDQKYGMTVSVTGQYAAVWNQDQLQILLINIHSSACHSLPLADCSDVLSPDNFSLCFSPDEMYLAVCFSDTAAYDCNVIQTFKTSNQKLLWYHYPQPGFLGPVHALFSPDSKTILLVLESHSQQQYNAETGELINKRSVENMSMTVVQFNWNRRSGAVEIGIPSNHDGLIYLGRKYVGKVPSFLEWREQAQIGGTHLFLMSDNHDMVVLRAPQ